MKTALITGVTGQDGSYLSELLLSNDYKVYGLSRISSSENTQRINHLLDNPNFKICYGDVIDYARINSLIKEIEPDEIYNLAAMSHVKSSYDVPVQTMEVNSKGTLNILESIRTLDLKEKTRFYQASTSEIFGNNNTDIQNELSYHSPQSPYACSKLYSYWMSILYRNAYKIFASNGIAFNHESPRRGEDFVTRKITKAAVWIKYGLQDKLYLGNLSSQRDWGHAKDYVYGMWKILQHDEPDDFILSTGVLTTIRDFCKKTFSRLGIDLEFEGEGVDERGYNTSNGKCIIEVSSSEYRPIYVKFIRGDNSKARKILGWEPKYTLDDIIDEMVSADLKLAEENTLLV